MERIKVRCVSIAPMIMNQADAERITRWVDSPGDQAVLPDPAKDFDSRIYRDPQGRVAIPRKMLLSALKHAGQSIKLGKTAITSKQGTLLSAILKIRDEWILIDGGEPGSEPVFTRDVRWGAVPRTKQGEQAPLVTGDGLRIQETLGPKRRPGRIVRPKLMTWGFDLTLEIPSPAYETTARKLFDAAGLDAGLGDFRPAIPNGSKWPSRFGRFQVVSWETTENVKTEADARVEYEVV